MGVGKTRICKSDYTDKPSNKIWISSKDIIDTFAPFKKCHIHIVVQQKLAQHSEAVIFQLKSIVLEGKVSMF